VAVPLGRFHVRISKSFKVGATLFCFVLAMSLSVAQAKKNAKTLSADEESVRKFLQSQDDDKTTRYFAVFRDLNGDGIPEAIVYLIGNEWCGTGGCNLLILQKTDGSWKTIASMTVTNPPIRMLERTCNGWHSLGVWVQGGGIRSGYEVEVPFDGRTYPESPFESPARRTAKNLKGEVLIRFVKNPRALW
jgi:hypothetical protein